MNKDRTLSPDITCIDKLTKEYQYCSKEVTEEYVLEFHGNNNVLLDLDDFRVNIFDMFGKSTTVF